MAVQHWCFAHNTHDDKQGESPWSKRHKKGKFPGKRVPFGALVDFLPSPIQGKNPKFAPSASPGLMLGYRMMPAGKWRGEYLVASLDDIQAAYDKGHAVHVQTVREIVVGDEVVFPGLREFDRRMCFREPERRLVRD
jgi:hypothetical protein